MAEKLSLDEATKIIGQINTLDAKLVSLIEMYSTIMQNFETNKKQIEVRKGLERQNEDLKAKASQIKDEVGSIKDDIQAKTKMVTESGWVVPLPKRDIAPASSMRI